MEKTEGTADLARLIELLKERLEDQSTKGIEVEETVTTSIQKTETRKLRITSSTEPPETAEQMDINYLSPATVLTVSYPQVDETILKRIIENFDDIKERQILFFQFKQNLEKIREVIPIKRGGKDRVLVGLIDAVRNVKSENLTLEQLKAIKEAISKLNQSAELRNEAADHLLKILVKADLEPVPKIIDVARYYEGKTTN